ncbi:MAG: glycoside hydrolase family 3 C-terminal domain-containing protein [Clostridiales bacterium]|jgi:beta-glucosidase|nr:glycoside hydrolase family 3 C-terminal domain-containing protein [Clostridiales bacterium]
MEDTRNRRLRRAEQIVKRMTLEQKVGLMSGKYSLEKLLEDYREGMHYNFSPYGASGCEELGVPGLRFCDGPRGVTCGSGMSTCFPVPAMRGASFDEELEEEIGRAIGKEARAYGTNLFGGVCVNVPYHPGWGRSQETYGEDSFAIGKLGAALVRGVQSEHVIACVKHFALNSIESSRFHVNIGCSERTLREVFLPHFKDCVDAGAMAVMTAYNSFNGVLCGHNRHLVTDILKGEWGFAGFALSDFAFGIKDTVEAANAGLDLEMCNTWHYGSKLVQAVRDGLVDSSQIDDSALRIASAAILVEEEYNSSGKNYTEKVAGCREHRLLALRSAQEGIVLLKNEKNTLPFKKSARKIAILGRLAIEANMGDTGSSCVFPARVVTIFDGISEMLPEAEIAFYDGGNLDHARLLAHGSDLCVIVAGLDHTDEGESVGSPDNKIGGGDRVNGLGLRKEEVDLINAAGAENPNNAVVLIGGGVILASDWIGSVSSALMAFYPGQEGGTAITQVLFGEINPSGKLPFAIPEKESDLPAIDWYALEQWYGYYHGYAKLDKDGVAPLFPFGFGLSYTRFSYSDPKFFVWEGLARAECTVTNTGSREGSEVVQMYAGFKNSSIDRPAKLLRGFDRISLSPGESKRVKISCPLEKLMHYNEESQSFELEHTDLQLFIGSSCAEKDLMSGVLRLS